MRIVEAKLNGTWENVTTFVLAAVKRGSPLTASYGQQAEVAISGAFGQAQASLSLINDDHRFTMGNPSSPYYPYWVPGIEMRVREQIDGALYDVVTGVLEIPEVEIKTPDIDQVTSVTIVDRWSALSRSPEFTSLLADYVLAYGNSVLAGYWPLTDAAGPFADLSVNGQPSLREGPSWVTSSLGSTAEVRPRQGEGPAGGELGAVELAAGLDASGNFASGRKLFTQTASLDVGVNEALTLVFWFAREVVPSTDDPCMLLLADTAGTNSIGVYYTVASSVVETLVDLDSSGWTCQVSGRDISGPTCIGVRVEPANDLVELWIGDDVYTDSTSGSAPSTTSLDSVTVGELIPSGSWSHVQVYIGDPDAWTHEDYLAQLAIANDALEGQTVTERLTTLAQLRGIEAAAWDFEDTDTRMQAAGLNGATITQLWDEAVRTDQGRMFVDPSGVIRFQTRNRRYYP